MKYSSRGKNGAVMSQRTIAALGPPPPARTET
jgi:hypothetical protein